MGSSPIFLSWQCRRDARRIEPQRLIADMERSIAQLDSNEFTTEDTEDTELDLLVLTEVDLSYCTNG